VAQTYSSGPCAAMFLVPQLRRRCKCVSVRQSLGGDSQSAGGLAAHGNGTISDVIWTQGE
jgi:hypothetical protein